MKVKAQNVFGLKKAEFDAGDGVFFVTGGNESGKTSLMTAIAAALMRAPVPWLDWTGKIACAKGAAPDVVVHKGTKSGSIRLSGDGWEINVSWPKCSVTEEGDAPRLGAYECGLIDIQRLPSKDRMDLLISKIGSRPTRQDLIDSGLGESEADLYPVSESDTWDWRSANAAKKAADLKGEWRAVTGETWGAVKADGWVGDWPRLSHGICHEEAMPTEETVERLETDRRDIEVRHYNARVTRGVGQAEIKRLDAMIQRLQLEVDTIAASSLTDQELMDGIDAARREVSEAAGVPVRPVPPRPDPVTLSKGIGACPSCGADLVLTGGVAALPPDASRIMEEHRVAVAAWEAEVISAKAANKARDARIYAARGKEERIRREIAAVDARARAIADLAAAVSERATKAATIADGCDDVGVIGEQLERTQAALDAAVRAVDAGKIHKDIIKTLRVAVALGPEGARKIALRRSLGEVEEEVTAMMGRSTSIMEDGGIVLEGIPYPLLSTSTKYLVDLCLRLVLAKRSGAPMIMIDGIDVLKDMRLYDAVNHILASGVKAIVAGAELPDFVISKGAAIRMTDGARTA